MGGEEAEGDLGGVEDLAAAVGLDGADENAVGGAGDEVADAVGAGEERHGAGVGFSGLLGGQGAVDAVGFSFAVAQAGVEGPLPGGSAFAQRGLRAFRDGGRRGQGCRRFRVIEGEGECAFHEGGFGHGFSVR